MLTRRDFVRALGATATAAALPADLKALAADTPQSFRFVFFTDTHIQPELHATDGCRMAFSKMANEPADFAICGGDLIFDGLAVNRDRAHLQWQLFQQTSAALHVPVHYTLGNHDVFGIASSSGVPATDPEYGKKAFQDRYGPTHYSFDHKGWHFIVLDTINVHNDGTYTGGIGAEQISWLKDDLARVGPRRPVIVVAHIPLVTGAINYVPREEWTKKTANLSNLVDTLMVTDAADVIDAMLPYNIRAVLQGHTHVNEDITFRGIRFITSGAVSGNWWRGVRAGSAEGYSVMHVDEHGAVQQQYVPYGFVADRL